MRGLEQMFIMPSPPLALLLNICEFVLSILTHHSTKNPPKTLMQQSVKIRFLPAPYNRLNQCKWYHSKYIGTVNKMVSSHFGYAYHGRTAQVYLTGFRRQHFECVHPLNFIVRFHKFTVFRSLWYSCYPQWPIHDDFRQKCFRVTYMST